MNSDVQGLNPFQMSGGSGDMMSFAIIPAPELPTTQPEVVGLFQSRQDNTLTVSSIPMNGGMSQGGGIVVQNSGGSGTSWSPGTSPESGPQVEIVVTNETIIYKETTEINQPSSGEQTFQQTVGEGSLDDLISAKTFITVWGRKNGDRIIAEVLFYSNPVVIQAP